MSVQPVLREDIVVEGVVKYVRTEVLVDFAPDSCIETCAVGRGVLNHFKMDAKFIPCVVEIFNPAYTAFFDANKRHPKDKEEMDLFGGWRIQIGGIGETPGRYDGHLCLVTRIMKKYVLLDLSLDQASRPNKNLDLTPMAVEVPESFLKGEDAYIRNTRGVLLIYKRHDNMAYKDTPAWNRTVDKLKALERSTFLVGRYLERYGFNRR